MWRGGFLVCIVLSPAHPSRHHNVASGIRFSAVIKLAMINPVTITCAGKGALNRPPIIVTIINDFPVVFLNLWSQLCKPDNPREGLNRSPSH